jgi:hypothetical protein
MKTSKAAKEYLKAHPVCEACGMPSNATHHIARRALTDTDKPENFLALCYPCHIVEYHGQGWRIFIDRYPHLEGKIITARMAHNLRTA